jgi:hypothetical protein
VSPGERNLAGGETRDQARRRDGREAQGRSGGDDRTGIGGQDLGSPRRLGQDHRLDRSQAKSAVRFGERRGQQAQFGHLGPQLARGIASRLGEQALGRVLQHRLVFGKIEIHPALTSPARSRR